MPNNLGTATSRLDKVIYQGEPLNGSCPDITDSILITVIPIPVISKVVEEAFCKSLCIDTATLKIDANTLNLVVLANNIDPTDTCGESLDFDFKFWNTDLNIPEPVIFTDLPSLPGSLTFDCDDKGVQNVKCLCSKRCNECCILSCRNQYQRSLFRLWRTNNFRENYDY